MKGLDILATNFLKLWIPLYQTEVFTDSGFASCSTDQEADLIRDLCIVSDDLQSSGMVYTRLRISAPDLGTSKFSF